MRARHGAATGIGRRALVALALIGVALAAAPLAFGMFDRGPKGAQMMAEFKPFMTDARLSGFQRHIANIEAGVRESDGAGRPHAGGPRRRGARSASTDAFPASPSSARTGGRSTPT